MIERLQKRRVLDRLILKELQSGNFPQIDQVLSDAERLIETRGEWGRPLTRLRPAIAGLPIGGETGRDIQTTFQELREDLELLYEALINLSVQTNDVYEVFAVRRDQLSARVNALRVELNGLLGQLHAGGQYTLTDSFNTLDLLDLNQTTAEVDLAEGLVTLPLDARRSVLYDGSKVKLFREVPLKGTFPAGSNFLSVFSPYRLDAWQGQFAQGGSYTAIVNVTGADYDRGGNEEVLLNGVRITPTGPVSVKLEWSPDGRNFHPLEAEINQTIRDRHTFRFSPVPVGYLRFTLKPVGGAGAMGVKRIELLRESYQDSAAVYSVPFQLPFPVQTVTLETDQETPFGTKVENYVSQDGRTWLPFRGEPLRFSNVQWKQVELRNFQRERTDDARFWKHALPDYPLPELGELYAGDDQVMLGAYLFDWTAVRDREHAPTRGEWLEPLTEVRESPFRPRGYLETPEAPVDAFVEDRNPLALYQEDAQSYLVLGIVQSDGQWVLQPGYNYRLRLPVWCPLPRALENQEIGIVNPTVSGGTAGTIVAPFSFYVNGEKVYEQTTSVGSLDALESNSYQSRVTLQQGWNELELLLQIPSDLVPGTNGLASGSVYLYLQPNVFSDTRDTSLGIDVVRAYPEPWRKVSEFDLRYNTPLAHTEVWSWKLTSGGTVDYLLLNHDPLNSGTDRDGNILPYWTVDGQNKGALESIALRYAVQLPKENARNLYFRSDLSSSPQATAPPVLRSYRLTVNS